MPQTLVHTRRRDPVKSKSRGFSLIELMIAVAIIGILAAIAYPSYQDHIRKARRADAQGALMGLAGVMERHFSDNNTYAGVVLGAGGIYPDWSPLDEPAANAIYTLTIPVANATAYTLRATPVAGLSNANDGFLQLTSAGQRAWDRNNNGAIDAGENTWER